MRIQKTVTPNDYGLCLKKYSQDFYSDNGEDGIIEKIFDVLKIKNGLACEFGAWDGKYKSNTFNLVKNHNWQCVMIEADSEKYLDLKNTAKKYKNITPINQKVTYDSEDMSGSLIDDILDSVDLGTEYDLISIDIDSCDYQVWKSMKKYKPKLLVIESSGIFNNVIHHPLSSYKLDIDGTTGFLPFYDLGKKKGYTLIVDTGNLFFLRNDCYLKIKNDPSLKKEKKFLSKIENIATVDLKKIAYWDKKDHEKNELPIVTDGITSAIAILKSIQRTNKTPNVLDVGSGTLDAFIKIRENVSLKYTALDTSDVTVKKGLENKLDIVKGHSNEIPFPDNSFDHVICYDLIEHLPDYYQTIKEMIRVSKDTGMIIITFFLPFMEHYSKNRGDVAHEIKKLGYEYSILKDSSIGFEQIYSKENKVYHFISKHNLGCFIKRLFNDKVNIYESNLGDRIAWIIRGDKYEE